MSHNPFRPLRSVGPLDDWSEYYLNEDNGRGLFVDYDDGPSLLRTVGVYVGVLFACTLAWASVIVGAILIVKAAS